MQNPEVKEKRCKTNLIRFGVPYNMQNADSFKKNQSASFRKKDYIYPSGRQVKVMGHEPFCLNYLLHIGYTEDQIVTALEIIPVFDYIKSNGKSSKYYPDIYIPHQNTIIEVKSTFTFDKDKIPITSFEKMQAVYDAGYDIYTLVFDDKGYCKFIKSQTHGRRINFNRRAKSYKTNLLSSTTSDYYFSIEETWY